MDAGRSSFVLAAVDLGSNTFKFTVAVGRSDGSIVELQSATETVRIGAGIEQTGRLEPARIDRAIVTLRQFEEAGRRHGATQFVGVATEALRVASNGQDLLDRISAETAWKIRLIPGDEEARLTFVGLKGHLPARGQAVIVDIGGGSTEWVEATDRSLRSVRSIALGSGRMADRFISTNPPGKAMLDAALQSAWETLTQELGPSQTPDQALFLSGGNGTYLDALRVFLEIGSQLDAATVMGAVDALTRMTAETVAEVLGMQIERAKVLPAGVAIAAAVVDYLRPASISAIPSGIVTGILTEETEDHFAIG